MFCHALTSLLFGFNLSSGKNHPKTHGKTQGCHPAEPDFQVPKIGTKKGGFDG